MDIRYPLVFARHNGEPNPEKPADYSHLRGGKPFTADELKATFGACVGGTNIYVGINDLNQDLGAFETNSMPFVQGWIDSTPVGERFRIMIGLEPNTFAAPGAAQYQYVLDNLSIVEKLGARLKEIMSACQDQGKTMQTVVRYASEMNRATGNPYSGQPGLFQQSYKKVYNALKSASADIRISFSPGINPGDMSDIADYWPGKSWVDMVGCTWYYVGAPDVERVAAKANLDAYFKAYATAEQPPCVDELGGAANRSPFGHNEAIYDNMRQHLVNLDLGGLALEHATFFLASYWGAGVELDGLCG